MGSGSSTLTHERAAALAAGASAVSTAFKSPHRLSTRFHFFGDDGTLTVVAKPTGTQKDVDHGLAYGLAHHQDRDLVLVLPAGMEAPTLSRVPWLDVPVFVWTYDPSDAAAQPRQVAIPSRAEVLAGFSDALETSEHRLAERAEWVARLAAWADANPDLVPAHRKTYHCWQCHGRAVLKIHRHRRGVAVRAGVQYSKQPIAFDEVLGSAMSSVQFDAVVHAVGRAVADRLGGKDVDDVEHRLQARLAAHPGALGLTHMEREFPAYRPGGRSYIDFLGKDRAGRIHVVETKVAGDEMLVLQALDYYIWACAHRSELAEHLSLEPHADVAVDFVVARQSTNQAFLGRYTPPQLEALDRSIDWRVHTVEAWSDGDLTVVPWPKKSFPPEKRISPPRYALRVERHLHACAPGAVICGVLHSDRRGGIAAEALPAYEALESADLLHRRVDHVRSSQAFAINLFGPLRGHQVAEVFRLVGVQVTQADPPVLEWSDPEDRLGELQPARPHQTQVDVVLRGVDGEGRKHVLFVEAKLTETDFGHCSGYTSDENDAREVCLRPGAFGGDPERCFSLRNHGGPHRRRYDELVGEVALDGRAVGCAFRLGACQPMRNIALATGLLDAGEADLAHFALCAPREHGAIWRRWESAKRLFTASRVQCHDLDAAKVVRLHDEPLRTWLERRYVTPVGEQPTRAGP